MVDTTEITKDLLKYSKKELVEKVVEAYKVIDKLGDKANKVDLEQIKEIPFTIKTLYRDRVDRMAAAIVSGLYANPTKGAIIESRIAAWAIEQIDAIDKALAEREGK